MGPMRTSIDRSRRLGAVTEAVLRKIAPRSAVRRRVQGVDLVLPRLHLLPHYAAACPAYGQNLVQLGAELSTSGRFAMIDVGANVGDSALQVLRAAPEAHVVCVEGDPAWLPWLHRNVDPDPRVTVVPALLSVDPAEVTGLVAVRHAGTTRFEQGRGDESVAPVAVDALPARHAGTPPVRLIKSDTDGHDTDLIPALAQAYASSTPVVFFEYDETLSAGARHGAPETVVARLAALGYDRFAAWDNRGDVVGTFTADHWDEVRSVMLARIAAGSHDFWDLAAAHRDDAVGAQILTRLAPTALTD